MAKTAEEWRAFNRTVIADFRKHGGRLPTRRYPVILLTTMGAISGEPRVVPLNFSTDRERLVVIASNGGSPDHPAWYRNLVVNPIVTIEHDGETFQARASTAEEPERTRLFDAQAATMSFFAGYRRSVKARQIPVVVFERIDAGR